MGLNRSEEEAGSTACIPRQCNRDRLRIAIVRRILDGSYAPGTHLKELALAKEFGVSQAPVREALRELEILGLVVSERYCGTRVLPSSAAELSEAYELKAVIEERSAQLAPPCDPADLVSLARDVESLRRAARLKSAEDYAAASVSFHRRVVAMSRNRQFLRSWENLHWEVRSRIAVQRMGTDIGAYIPDHAAILEAFCADDGHKAGALLRRNIEAFLTHLSRVSQARKDADD